jgi:hypothetical protein
VSLAYQGRPLELKLNLILWRYPEHGSSIDTGMGIGGDSCVHRRCLSKTMPSNVHVKLIAGDVPPTYWISEPWARVPWGLPIAFYDALFSRIAARIKCSNISKLKPYMSDPRPKTNTPAQEHSTRNGVYALLCKACRKVPKRYIPTCEPSNSPEMTCPCIGMEPHWRRQCPICCITNYDKLYNRTCSVVV